MNTKIIVSNPNILGGDPVIKGTRVSVNRIKYLLKQDFPISAIKNMYPHVSRKTLVAVIDEVFSKSLQTPSDAKTSAQI